MTKNLNPFSLDRKLSYQNKHEIIYMVWKECMPGEFYKYISLKENFLYLNGKNVLCPKVSDIIQKSIELDEKNYARLKIYLHFYFKIVLDIYLAFSLASLMSLNSLLIFLKCPHISLLSSFFC